MSETVNSFTPSVREDCGTVYWSHPAFSGGFGVPSEYVVYVNGGPAAPYMPGSEVQVATDGEPWMVTLKAKYVGKTFEHQIGQHKGQGETCTPVEEPAVETPMVVPAQKVEVEAVELVAPAPPVAVETAAPGGDGVLMPVTLAVAAGVALVRRVLA